MEELALTSNFDAELFDCWDDDDDNDNDNDDNEEVDGNNDNNDPSSRSQSRSLMSSARGTGNHRGSALPAADGDNDDGNDGDDDDDHWGISETFEQFSRLPSFSLSLDHDYDVGRRSTSKDDVTFSAATGGAPAGSEGGEAGKSLFPFPSAAAGKAALVSAYASVASTSRSDGSNTASSSSDASSMGATASSTSNGVASQPDSASGTSGPPTQHEASSSTKLHPMAIQSSANCPPHLEHCAGNRLGGMMCASHSGLSGLSGIDASSIPTNLLPLAMSALAAGASLGHHPFFTSAASSMNQNNHPATTAAAAAAAAAAAVVAASGASDLSLVPPPQVSHGRGTTTLPLQPALTSGGGMGVPPPPPPFLLFDAPVELRTNYQQSLRAHGLPIALDNNAYHFGVAVNGFHPQNQPPPTTTTGGFGGHLPPTHQLLHRGNAALGAVPTANAVDPTSTGPVRLVDARHGTLGVKRIKNAKEQRRAQRIAELIDELRAKMQSSGWSVGVSKSKYNTLSSYVFSPETFETELRRRSNKTSYQHSPFVFDFNLQSCAQYVKHLVHSTKEKEEAVRRARNDLDAKQKKLEEEKSQQDPSDPESTTSTLTASSDSDAAKAPTATWPGPKDSRKRDAADAGEPTATNKKPKLCSHESSVSSSVSFGGDDVDEDDNPSGSTKAESSDAMGSSVSDLTDSNKDTVSRMRTRARSSHPEGADTGGEQVHKDVVVPKRKSSNSGCSLHSLSTDFQLDYREVFLKSNIPQLIATTAGRIIACECFLDDRCLALALVPS